MPMIGMMASSGAKSDTWKTRTGPTTYTESGAAATYNNIIYTFGGLDTFSARTGVTQAYNPATDTWSSKATMTRARYNLAGAANPLTGIIYAVGGNSTTSFMDTYFEAYDTTANTWTSKTAMSVGRRELGAAFADDTSDYIYAIGGYNVGGTASNANEAYNITTNTWSSKANMTTARYGLGVVNNQSNKIFAVGGLGTTGNENESYNFTTNTWSSNTAMTTSRSAVQLAAHPGVVDGFFALGGKNISPGSELNTNEYFNGSSWSTKKVIPTVTSLYPAATATLTGSKYKIYIPGNGNIEYSIN